jgi:hypothetical protein
MTIPFPELLAAGTATESRMVKASEL